MCDAIHSLGSQSLLPPAGSWLTKLASYRAASRAISLKSK